MDHTLLISPLDLQMAFEPLLLWKPTVYFETWIPIARSLVTWPYRQFALLYLLYYCWPTYQYLSLRWAHLSLLFGTKSNSTFTYPHAIKSQLWNVDSQSRPHLCKSSYLFPLILRNFYLKK